MYLETNKAKNTLIPYLISLFSVGSCSHFIAQETGNCCPNGATSGLGQQGTRGQALSGKPGEAGPAQL